MTNEEKVFYLSNLIFVAGVDRVVREIEARTIESIRREIGASESALKKALQAVAHGSHEVTPVGRFSEKVQNLEDMILVAISDGEISKSEKPEILSFAKTIKVSQKQITEILSEAKRRLKLQRATITCASCEKEIPSDSIFCCECGHRIVSS